MSCQDVHLDDDGSCVLDLHDLNVDQGTMHREQQCRGECECYVVIDTLWAQRNPQILQFVFGVAPKTTKMKMKTVQVLIEELVVHS